MQKQNVFEAIGLLIEHAREDPALRAILQYGTPQQKLEVLSGDPYNLTFEDLVQMHKEIELIIYQGSVKWWWW